MNFTREKEKEKEGEEGKREDSGRTFIKRRGEKKEHDGPIPFP